MGGDFTIKSNTLPWPIKDIDVSCELTAPRWDGNRASNVRTVYEACRCPTASKRINGFNMGIHYQSGDTTESTVEPISVVTLQ